MLNKVNRLLFSVSKFGYNENLHYLCNVIKKQTNKT